MQDHSTPADAGQTQREQRVIRTTDGGRFSKQSRELLARAYAVLALTGGRHE